MELPALTKIDGSMLQVYATLKHFLAIFTVLFLGYFFFRTQVVFTKGIQGQQQKTTALKGAEFFIICI